MSHPGEGHPSPTLTWSLLPSPAWLQTRGAEGGIDFPWPRTQQFRLPVPFGWQARCWSVQCLRNLTKASSRQPSPAAFMAVSCEPQTKILGLKLSFPNGMWCLTSTVTVPARLSLSQWGTERAGPRGLVRFVLSQWAEVALCVPPHHILVLNLEMPFGLAVGEFYSQFIVWDGVVLSTTIL